MRILDAGDELSRGLAGFWPLDEGAGQSALDLSPHRNHGRGVNAPTWNHGPRGKAAAFSGPNGTSTQHFNVGQRSGIGDIQIPITIAAWVYQTSTSGFQPVLAQYAQFSAGTLVKMLRTDNGTLKYYTTSSGGTFQAVGTLAPSAGKWNFVAAVIGGTVSSPTCRMYLNGTQEAPSLGALRSTFTATIDSCIGSNINTMSHSGNEGWTGRIQGVRFWRRALTNPEIQRIYADPWAGTVRERRRVWYLPSAGLAGSLSATLADATLSAAGGATGIEGVLAVTLADATGSAAGALAIAGAASVALADASVSSAGALAIAGALSTALADATLSSAGALAIAGSLSATLADAALSAVGTGSSNAGALAVTLADATLVAAGALAIAGAASVALADASVSSAGTLAIVGSLSAALADATLSSAGALAITGSLSATLADATLAAVGTGSSNTGALAVTLADATLTSAGALAISGGAGLALADAVLVSAGTVALRGSLSAVLADAGISAAGALVVSGSLAVTLANASLSAVGNFAAVVVMSPPARRTYRLDVAARRAQLAQDLRAYMVAAESRITRLPRDDET